MKIISKKINTSNPNLFFLYFVLVLLFTISGCGSTVTEEDKIRKTISDTETAIENGNPRHAAKFVSDSYSDSSNRTKADLLGYLRYHVLRNQSIHLFTSISSIEQNSDNEAVVQLYCAMTGTPVESNASLFNLQADIYKFDLTMARENNKWLLKSATWQPAMVEDILK